MSQRAVEVVMSAASWLLLRVLGEEDRGRVVSEVDGTPIPNDLSFRERKRDA